MREGWQIAALWTVGAALSLPILGFTVEYLSDREIWGLWAWAVSTALAWVLIARYLLSRIGRDE